MRALTVTPGVKNSIRLEDIDPPTPSSSQALLRLQEIGICGTDLDINQGFYGEAPAGSSYLVTGHESLATVESILGNAHGISRGDLVVPTVRRPDSCMNCLKGESDMCVTGNYREHGIKRLHGFGSEFAVSDVQFLVKVPSKLADVAVLLEPMSVAEKGVYQAFKIQERMLWKPKRVLILGAGPVGLLTTYLLRLKGLQVVVTATRAKDSAKARLAERAGAVYVNTGEQSGKIRPNHGGDWLGSGRNAGNGHAEYEWYHVFSRNLLVNNGPRGHWRILQGCCLGQQDLLRLSQR
ncbi:hypothetical protein E6H13_09585 [Candidatus Bathyarchaeota archaeon]|nr:MAG: hypothetical protein E6H13_09585 [Candidatus Bathyarchaeota archaeon]